MVKSIGHVTTQTGASETKRRRSHTVSFTCLVVMLFERGGIPSCCPETSVRHGIPLEATEARNNPSTWFSEEYGAGEEIDITVTFNYPVVVLVGTVLLIDTGEETTWGEAVYLSGNGTDAVTFLYTVAEGDRSVDLGTFEGGEAEEGGGLIGTVLRSSDNPTQVRCWV